MPNLRALTRRRLQLVASLVLAFAALVAIWQLLGVLLPFLVSGAIAYLLHPLILLLMRTRMGRRWPRATRSVAAGTATLAVIVVVLAVLAAGVFRLVEGSMTLADRAPSLVAEATVVWEELQGEYQRRVPANIQKIIDPRLDELRGALVQSGFSAAQRVSQVAQSGISQVIALAGAPIILFYLLYEPARVGRDVEQLLPAPLRDDLMEIGHLVGQSIGAYLRLQLLLGIVVGLVMWLSLWALGVPLSGPLGALAGLAELVPVVGPTIYFIFAAVIMALVDFTKLPVVLAVYLVVQALQNTLISPRLQGQALGLHPLTVILVLALFGLFLGFLGTLLAAPLTAAGYRVLYYTRQQWSSAPTLESHGGEASELPTGDADADQDTSPGA